MVGWVLVIGDSLVTACELPKNASLSLSFHPDQTQSVQTLRWWKSEFGFASDSRIALSRWQP